ncbi:MAG: response regulator transcription factor [Chloroflexi bacterium]|nr:response regulator transcription factor [Chloroflexota bacterium]
MTVVRMPPAASTRVLVVAGDESANPIVRRALWDEGYEVFAAPLRQGLQVRQRPDLVVIDPAGLRGDALAPVREQWPRVPVIVIGADDPASVSRWLDMGADECVPHGFHPDEFAARVRAVLRRRTTEQCRGQLAIGDVIIDLDGRRVSRAGEPVRLTGREWGILETLAEHPDAIVSHVEILEQAWSREENGRPMFIRAHIFRLRRKLGLSADGLQTIHGVGYRLVLRSRGIRDQLDAAALDSQQRLKVSRARQAESLGLFSESRSRIGCTGSAARPSDA